MASFNEWYSVSRDREILSGDPREDAREAWGEATRQERERWNCEMGAIGCQCPPMALPSEWLEWPVAVLRVDGTYDVAGVAGHHRHIRWCPVAIARRLGKVSDAG